MNLHELSEAIEKMSEDELKAIVGTEFGEELEKEATAEVAQADLENALYAYGAYKADVEVESEEAGEAGLSKEASEQFESAEKEISEAIEAGVSELGLDNIEDDAELHKTAMSCATVIFEGYCDQLEKIAAKGKGLKAMAKSVGKKAKGLAKKHGKSAALLAGGAAAGYGARAAMDKKASELTAEELIDMTLGRQAVLDIIVDGIEKLAARGKAKAGMLSKGLKALKKHKGALGAGAAGGAAGYMAGRMQKKAK